KPVKKPEVTVCPVKTEPTVEGKTALMCLASDMFPPLVQISWKRQEKNNKQEQLPPAEEKQVEFSGSERSAMVRLVNNDTLYNYEYICEVMHEGGKVRNQTLIQEVEKTIVRYEEDVRLLEICWKPQIKLTRIGPRIKEDLKPAGIVVNPEEPEPPQFGSGHEEQHLLTFLIHSSQQVEQLLRACETNTFMDLVTDHQSVFSQSEPDTEQLHSQNPPEDQKSSTELHSFYLIVSPDPEQIQEEHYGSEPRPVQQEQEICRSWEEEHLKSRTSEEHGWSKAKPDTEQLHSQNPPEDQQRFIELKSVYSCVTPDPEQIKDQPEPPHFQQQQEIYRSWEEEHLMGRTSWEHIWPSYTAHMKSHRKDTTSACSRCGERFDDQRAVATHMKTCRKLHSCDTCGKSFSSRSLVKYHKKRGSCGGNVELKP
ncbi:hypothetical protein GOODEAATRI_017005, partial [Goodea atripinnis]